MTDRADVDEWVKAGERRQRRWAIAGGVAVALGLAIYFGVTMSVGANMVPAGDDRVLSALRAQGLTDPKLGTADALACAEGESSRHFTATNAQGARVDGTVCCGLTGVGKGCTIRWGR